MKKNILLIYLLFLFTEIKSEKKEDFEKSFVKLKSKDINFTLGGRIKEDYFFYQRVRTLSDKFFDQNGFLNPGMAEKLHDDISILLYPSARRALALNKAYKTIVVSR